MLALNQTNVKKDQTKTHRLKKLLDTFEEHEASAIEQEGALVKLNERVKSVKPCPDGLTMAMAIARSLNLSQQSTITAVAEVDQFRRGYYGCSYLQSGYVQVATKVAY